jgi:hypothetical protein
VVSSLPIASTPQDSEQGRTWRMMALYGQTPMHFPHLMHLS